MGEVHPDIEEGRFGTEAVHSGIVEALVEIEADRSEMEVGHYGTGHLAAGNVEAVRILDYSGTGAAQED